jgi:hypothetical protein
MPGSTLRVPSPSLDPRVITHGIAEYEAHESLLGPTLRAFQTGYKAIEDIFTARAAVEQDTTKTPAAQAVAISDFAFERQMKAALVFDTALKNADQAIGSYEDQLSKPLIADAGRGTVNDAIRAHVKGLAENERLSFVRAAISGGDVVTAKAVLGAPSYLSGLSNDIHAALTRQYHERESPQITGNLNALKKAKAALERSGPLLLTETIRAIGMDWDEIGRIKAAKVAADRALKSLT